MSWVLPFHLQRVNKLYRKYNQSGSPSKSNICWNSETTQNLNIYLHNYQTEAAIFQATKHEKTIMACSYLNFSSHTENPSKQQKMVAVVRNCLVKMTLRLF